MTIALNYILAILKKMFMAKPSFNALKLNFCMNVGVVHCTMPTWVTTFTKVRGHKLSGRKAWVTLATNDSYCLGALVLAQSLKKVNTTYDLVILITSNVTYAMRGTLQSVFSEVKEVNVLDSGDVENLRLLARPELGITFTKLHCWRLTQYEKCVFLDADTLVLQNCDELFDREEFSAAPDVGWPDCFNSGVFVFKPSEETYQALVNFAVAHGSFDGGDQGLLNMYFSGWATSDCSKRLSFLYNLSSAAIYSYLPAFKWFGKGVKIMHFIGNAKPWLQSFNSETRIVAADPTCSHITNFLQYWWDLFCADVYPGLSPEMTRLLLRYWFTPQKPALNYNPPRSSLPRIDPKYPFNDLIIPDEKIVPEFEEHYQFTDPWEVKQTVENTGSYDDDTEVSSIYNQHAEPADTVHHNDDGQGTAYLNTNLTDHLDYCTDGIHCGTPAQSICGDFSWEPSNSQPEPNSTEPMHLVRKESGVTGLYAEHNQIYVSEYYPSCHSVAPFKFFLANSLNEVSLEGSEISRTNETTDAAGVASTLSQMKLEEPSPEQTAREDFLRRQNWEHGNIDYLGRDSFDNILSKITQTINKQSEPDPAPTSPVTTVASDVCASPVTATPPAIDTPVVCPMPAAPAAPAAAAPSAPDAPVACPLPAAPAAPTAAAPSAPDAPVTCPLPAARTAAAPPTPDASVACSLPPAPIAAALPAAKAPVVCSMTATPPTTDAPVACSMPAGPVAVAPLATDVPVVCSMPSAPVTAAVSAPDTLDASPVPATPVAPAAPAAADTSDASPTPATPVAPTAPAAADASVACPKPAASVAAASPVADAPVATPAPAAPIVPASPTSDVPVAPTPPKAESVQAKAKSQADSELAGQSASKSECTQKVPPSRQSSAQEGQGKSGQKSGGKKK